jgi:hypothetical protein
MTTTALAPTSAAWVARATLARPEQDSLTRGAEGEDPVEPRLDEEVHERRKRIFVEAAPVLVERRDGCSESALQHALTLSSSA